MSRYYRKSPMKSILPPEISTGADAGMTSVDAQLGPISFDVGYGLHATLSESGIDLSPVGTTFTTQKKSIFDYLPWILVAILIFVLLVRK